jgi:hypothetical protein
MAAAAKRPPLPVILIANDLLEGDVVFGVADGFTRNPAQALVATDAATADALEAAGLRAVAERRVVDAYLVDVTLEAGHPVPRHYRERQRTLGPSNRPDLGKQADFARV